MTPSTHHSIVLNGCVLQNLLQLGLEFPVLAYRCDVSQHCLHVLNSLKTGRKVSGLIQLLERILPQQANDQAPLKAQ